MKCLFQEKEVPVISRNLGSCIFRLTANIAFPKEKPVFSFISLMDLVA